MIKNKGMRYAGILTQERSICKRTTSRAEKRGFGTEEGQAENLRRELNCGVDDSKCNTSRRE
jgi:hypothetical protein